MLIRFSTRTPNLLRIYGKAKLHQKFQISSILPETARVFFEIDSVSLYLIPIYVLM